MGQLSKLMDDYVYFLTIARVCPSQMRAICRQIQDEEEEKNICRKFFSP